jgi:hypothetical protein
MEIKGIGGPSGPNGLTKTAKKGDNTDFREVLQARIAQTGPASPVRGPDMRPVFVAQSEKLIGLLDDFARGLANPRKTLKEMAPLVQSMEGELRDLETGFAVEKGEDQDLSRLLSEVSLLTRVTLFKFHRGDFI